MLNITGVDEETDKLCEALNATCRAHTQDAGRAINALLAVAVLIMYEAPTSEHLTRDDIFDSSVDALKKLQAMAEQAQTSIIDTERN